MVKDEEEETLDGIALHSIGIHSITQVRLSK
jgi:hypothetical protein